jgi:hypothetical protein
LCWLAEHKPPQRKRAEVQRFAIVIPKRDSNTTETRPRDGPVLSEPGRKLTSMDCCSMTADRPPGPGLSACTRVAATWVHTVMESH